MTRADDTVVRGRAPAREIFAWSCFDFANSGYTTVILTTVFAPYFVRVVAQDRTDGTFLWTLTLSVSYCIILIGSPIVGAIADLTSSKKYFLAWATVLCVLFTAALYVVGPGDVMLAALFVVLSNVFFSTGESLVAAFLPELGPPEDLGKISGYGWAWGYVGGLIALALCLAYLRSSAARGVSTEAAIPLTNVIVAILFAGATLPTFLWLRERGPLRNDDLGIGHLRIGFRRVRTTFHEARRFSELFKLLACVGTYHCGINVVVFVTAIFADQELGFSPQEIIVLILVLNISAALGALFFGPLQDRLGSKRVIAITLILWTVTLIGASMVQTRSGFWILGNLAGIAMGSSQSAGRALVGLFSPRAKTAEFFGLWGMAVKASAIVGSMAYGTITLFSGSHRLAILATTLFFIGGLLLLSRIDEEQGRRAAIEFSPLQ